MFAILRHFAFSMVALSVFVVTSTAMAGELRSQCYDGIDNDHDGYIDGADTDCGGSTGSPPPKDLKTFLADLQNQIDALQTEVAYLNNEVQILQASSGSGDSNPALNYMDVVGGELVFSGIDVRLQNGNLLIGTGGVGSGLHNLIIGHNNIWDGDYGVIVGTNNEVTKDFAFIYGDWNTVRGSYSGIFGGVGSQILSGNSVIVGGSQNLIQNFGIATLVGGRQRTGGNTTYEVIADG